MFLHRIIVDIIINIIVVVHLIYWVLYSVLILINVKSYVVICYFGSRESILTCSWMFLIDIV